MNLVDSSTQTAARTTLVRPNPRDGALVRSPVLWLSLTCLDAPVVALVWQSTFARAFGIPVNLGARIVLFLTAWLIYLADRIADSFTLGPNAPASVRLLFCLRHRRQMIALAVPLAVADAILTLTLLQPATLVSGGIVLAAIALYLAVNHFAGYIWRHVPLKELAVGFLFAFGVTTIAHRATGMFVLSVLWFGALCSLNCLSISVWERDLDLAQGRTSFAISCSKLRGLAPLACVVLGASAICLSGSPRLRVLTVPIALSAFLLALLHRVRTLSRDQRVALADLVLLTPILTRLFV